MANIISEVVGATYPDFGGFEVVGIPEAGNDYNVLLQARENVAGGNGREICVQTVRQDPGEAVEVTVQVWDSEPAVPANWEGPLNFTLECPDGYVVVDQRTLGPSIVVEFYDTPGTYFVRIMHSGRGVDMTSCQLVSTGTGQEPLEEKYLIAMWRMDGPSSTESH